MTERTIDIDGDEVFIEDELVHVNDGDWLIYDYESEEEYYDSEDDDYFV